MVWALSLNVRMVANPHRLDLPHHVGHSVLCCVQLQQAVCQRLLLRLRLYPVRGHRLLCISLPEAYRITVFW